ncbi:MAG TPA: hypothetical protein VEW45_02485 [Candidatus Dormibacteraeota bacterium]|nr:hypothetical protein [Candidatus Dormibacteraeota bacterium]
MGRSRSHRHTYSRSRQLDLFDPDPEVNAATVPVWMALPEATRSVLTDLMTHLLIGHGDGVHATGATEAADDR